MLDWGMFTANNVAGATGLDALKGGQSKWHGLGMSMARMLGSDPNQVAVAGRRVMVGWVSGVWQMQGLPQDLSIGSDGSLRQAFVPELQTLRAGAGIPVAGSRSVAVGQQAEFVVTITGRAGEAGVKVLLGTDGAATSVGVDFDRGLVFVDATQQGDRVRRAGPLLGHTKAAAVTLHLMVDHSVVVAIFNNRTALTAIPLPPSAGHANAATFGGGGGGGGVVVATAWRLKTANANLAPSDPEAAEGLEGVSSPAAWQVPKIHNAPVCNRYPAPR